jgi:hypothetical protein
MAVDGTYNIEVDSPMGRRTGKLELKTDGGSLSGSYTGEAGQQAFDGGTVSGNDVAWSINVSGPMGQVKLDFKGRVEGDAIAGQVQLGSFGTASFTGRRT